MGRTFLLRLNSLAKVDVNPLQTFQLFIKIQRQENQLFKQSQKQCFIRWKLLEIYAINI